MTGTLIINYHCFNLSKVLKQTGNHRSALWLVFTFKSYRRMTCTVYVHSIQKSEKKKKSLDSLLLSVPSTLVW